MAQEERFQREKIPALTMSCLDTLSQRGAFLELFFFKCYILRISIESKLSP